MTLFYRRMPKFDYLRPTSIEEALAAISESDPVRNQVFSGGTDLMPKLKSRAIEAPPRVIDLKGISDLAYIEYSPEAGLRLGANTTIREVARSAVVAEHYRALSQGAALIASNQLQNRGTIVGNICNAVPSADSAPPLLAHDARIVCVGRAGERVMALTDFFIGPGITALVSGEIVKEVRLPPPQRGESSTYLKLAARGRMDLAVVGVAAALVFEEGMVRQLRLGLGSAAPIPTRAPEAESIMLGQRLTPALIAQAAGVAAMSSRTRSSHRASAEYRRDMIEVLVRRALTQLTSDAPVAA